MRCIALPHLVYITPSMVKKKNRCVRLKGMCLWAEAVQQLRPVVARLFRPLIRRDRMPKAPSQFVPR